MIPMPAFRIRSDHNEDNSEEIIDTWLSTSKDKYHSVLWNRDPDSPLSERRANETSIFHWPEERFRAMMEMKEEALSHARNIWADYVLVSDRDERPFDCPRRFQ